MALADFGEVLAYEAAFLMQAFEDPTFPVDQLGDLSIELSTKLRALAIIELLVNANSDGFYHNLIRSGIARLLFLDRARQSGIVAHHSVSGRYDSLLDLIAVGDFERAVYMRNLSPQQWQQGHEYEDDYCYAQILFRLIDDNVSPPAVEALATRSVAALDGKLDARVSVCLALARGESSDFAKAFGALLKQHTAALEADKTRSQTITPEITALRLVYVEGLAMLRLAVR
jgi:hypothetical protein